jgi:S-DNA-T family DNA segregation ATPase FtsK/SpoIIIE
LSLFNRKRFEPIDKTVTEEFKIHQFIKIEGLKSKLKPKYKPSEFVSPIFGLTVKDVTVAPYINRDTGDKAKQFDFIRENPLEDRSTYREFKSTLVSAETRKKMFGDEVVIDYSRKYVDPRKKKNEIHVPYTGKKTKPTFSEVFDFEEERFVPPKKVEIVEPDVEQVIKPEEKPFVSPEKQEELKPFEKPTIEPETYQPEFTKKTYQSPSVEETLRPKPVHRQQRRPYRFPTLEMFSKVERDQDSRPEWVLLQEQAVNETLAQFNVPGKVKNIIKGPTVTRHEIELEPGVNVRTVSNIKDNLMMNLAATSIRIEAPIPGKPYVGLELPNAVPETVAFGSVVSDPKFIDNQENPLMIALGVDIDGDNIFADIKKMPHGLIAGATNSGKSVCINTIIMSLLMKNHPDDLKFILIDPKMVELSIYNDIPHLATPVITDAKVASMALSWAVEEMERRFIRLSDSRAKDIDSYNEKAISNPELEKMPHIIIVIDELADLMTVSASDVEESIQRITQKARASGIHLLVATQRPTTDVVKGTIKANIPTRIAFRVASFTDSTTILDGAGAELLLGRGDMLLKTTDRPIRLQGCYIQENEIERVTDFIKDQLSPNYLMDLEDLQSFFIKKESLETDELLVPVMHYIVLEQTASINAIQKQFGIGFNRAQRIMEILEQQGVVSASEGTKARQVLITKDELEQLEDEF